MRPALVDTLANPFYNQGMTTYLEKVSKRHLKKNIPEFSSGDRVRVNFKISEGEKDRIQPFEGVVVRVKRGNINAAVTIRKMSHGVGVEKTFPLHSTRLESLEVLSQGKVRRARLFYLRDLKGKKARIQSVALGAATEDDIKQALELDKKQSTDSANPETEDTPLSKKDKE